MRSWPSSRRCLDGGGTLYRIKIAIEINLERWAGEGRELFGIPIRSFWAPNDKLAKFVPITLQLPAGDRDTDRRKLTEQVMEINLEKEE